MVSEVLRPATDKQGLAAVRQLVPFDRVLAEVKLGDPRSGRSSAGRLTSLAKEINRRSCSVSAIGTATMVGMAMSLGAASAAPTVLLPGQLPVGSRTNGWWAYCPR
jgi:hypothetical protein